MTWRRRRGIVVTAAKKHGAKAVGVEIDPSASRRKVADLVTIRKEDMFKTYLAGARRGRPLSQRQANLALRPALKKSLKPGSRVVSQTWAWATGRPTDRHDDGVDEKDGMRYEYKLYSGPFASARQVKRGP